MHLTAVGCGTKAAQVPGGLPATHVSRSKLCEFPCKTANDTRGLHSILRFVQWVYACVCFAELRIINITFIMPLPLPGMYLSDLTFIETGSPDYLALDPSCEGQVNPVLSTLINFGKRSVHPQAYLYACIRCSTAG